MPISRRQFCSTIGAGLALANHTLIAADSQSPPLRVIAYNIFGLRGWPHDRPRAQQAVTQRQMARRLAMELALHQPDIVNFSESPREELTKEVAEILGMNHVRFPSGGNWPGTLLSKTQVNESQNVPVQGGRPKELFTRHWGRATITLPGEENLIVHSAHLYPTREPTVRLKEIRAMIESMKPDIDAGRSMLLIGDLNHGPDTEEYRLWMDAGWVDTFSAAGEGDGLTFLADVPDRRIDYIMACGPIADRVLESKPLFEGNFRLNVDDATSFALSDHLPQAAVFAGK
ncbi:endonuclease/exonuclease/phosphatase family protein [Allorhodopirellula solitaria]|uniref:Endonuclease/Exonuclease/phosphatase family protein n=1 Tax=Allorhodopirellula solitaria TaxID=2527987 RepID=A0A5C5Y1Y0_9BACT|nr:endonuclease/exonuclease/phosphatase family protein [Allorhodopirellula solitaria]TWT67552.1 Endonuclease/Exonuclease/phosphatase family protein [Allorhodopirellula solitaria]